MKKIILILILITALPSYSAISPRKSITTIVLGGLAGGVLGLSTLSFYKTDQQRHTRNIALGASIGVILATGYVTYLTATGKGIKEDSQDKDDLKKYDGVSHLHRDIPLSQNYFLSYLEVH